MATKAIAKRRSAPARLKARRRSKSKAASAAVLLGFAPLVSRGITSFKAGGIPAVAEGMTADLTGYSYSSGVYDMRRALYNSWLPIGSGVIIHKAANKLGVNRYLKRIPFIGKYIAL